MRNSKNKIIHNTHHIGLRSVLRQWQCW